VILPIYAALERVPSSFIEASGDLGARYRTTLRRVILPMAMPGIIAGSIFAFALTLGDYIVPSLAGTRSSWATSCTRASASQTMCLRRRVRTGSVVIMALYLMGARKLKAFEPYETPRSRVPGVRIGMGVGTGLVLAFLFIPLAVIMLYAFNTSVAQTWPIPGFSTKWFTVAWHNPEVRSALWMSVKAGLGATAIALTLGSLAAFAIHRFKFFGREAVSFLLVLPLALPASSPGWPSMPPSTSAARSSGSRSASSRSSSATRRSAIVVVYNNVIARLRRTAGSLTEASMDLGADGWQTFRYVTLPSLATALLAGGLLAFALSFD